MIKRAFDCFSKPPILELPDSFVTDTTKTTNLKNARHEQATINSIEVHQGTLSNEQEEKPLKIFSNAVVLATTNCPKETG